MLLCGIIDELRSRLRRPAFCPFSSARQPTHGSILVLRGLIYLLLCQQPSIICHVLEKYDHAGKALFQDTHVCVALSEMLTNILQNPNLMSTFLIIDALDECRTDLPQLLDFIAKQSAASRRVKWIVSSRNWPDIDEQLEKAGRKARLSLELNAESVSTAVSIYIGHTVRALAERKHYDSKTEIAVRTYLSSNANDTLLCIPLGRFGLPRTGEDLKRPQDGRRS
jgi:hypothetical protein